MNIPDQQQRQQALDISKSFIVQAPAGSGKTELLIQRTLALLAHCQHPEQVFAITFTRKAAAEMRHRIMKALQDAADKIEVATAHAKRTRELALAVLTQDEKQQWHLLQNPNRLRMQTIDSLCASLTKQMPILSQTGAPLEIVEYSIPLYQQAVRMMLTQLDKDTPWAGALENILLHLDNRISWLENLLISMLARRESWLPYLADIHSSESIRERLELGLQNIVSENLEFLQEALTEIDAHELFQLARFAASNLDADNTIATCETLDDEVTTLEQAQGLANLLLKKDGGWRKSITKVVGFPAASSEKDKERKALLVEMKKRMTLLLEEIQDNDNLNQVLQMILITPRPCYSESQWQITESLLELLPVAAAHLRLVFQLQQKIDFTEITSSALQALGTEDNPTDLTLALDYKIQHILVDEFQDTSATHLRLLERLTAGWDVDDGRTLFIVGDPMQSIYRFRQAEVGLFLQVQRFGINGMPLTPLTLQANFRSQAHLIEWFNETFAKAFPTHEDIAAGAISFSSSQAMKEPLENAVNYHVSTSAQTADIITCTKNTIKNHPNDSIAVLVKSRSHLLNLLTRFQDESIPYQAIDIENLQQHQIILDLLSLTKAWLFFGERLSWLSILRAPWCGLTLHDLTIIAEDEEQTIWQRLQQYQDLPLTPDAKTRVSTIVNIFEVAIKNRYRDSLRSSIENLWRQLQGPQCLNSSEDLDNALMFFDLLESTETGGDIADITELEQRLPLLYAKPQTTNQNTIQVLTMHKSKGLEFDHVILPSIEKRTRANTQQLLLFSERPAQHGGSDLILAPIKSAADKSSPIYAYLQKLEGQKQFYENARLLYVATTRARKSLHLFTQVQVDDDFQPVAPNSTSLLYHLWPSLEMEFKNNLKKPKSIDLNIKPHIHTLARLPLDKFSNDLIKNESMLEQSNHKLWEQKSSALIGTFIHRLLKQLSTPGLLPWQANQLNEFHPSWRASLLRLGVPNDEIDAAIQITHQAIHNCLNDDKAQWILQPYETSGSEYPITHLFKGKIIHSIIDRTFIDEGVRWIIDYKTSSCELDELDNFITIEHQQYQPQLENYAKLISEMENLPIKLGLYFPLMSAWHEWDFV